MRVSGAAATSASDQDSNEIGRVLAIGVRASSEWLARDHDGFIFTGTAANTNNLLETAVPGVFAAGDVRSGSTKRCATAVGEGSMAVQFVHAHLTRTAYVEGAR